MGTRGAAGWDHFRMGDSDYLCSANFFTSSPRRQPSMSTDSTVFSVFQNADLSLKLTEVQGFKTTGAHGVMHASAGGFHYLAVPNYYGVDTVIMRAGEDDGTRRFVETQRIPTDGGGGVEVWNVGDSVFLGIAEFNLGVAAIYKLDSDRGLFQPWQRLAAPGCGALSVLAVPAARGGSQLLLVAASYVTQRTGWRTMSSVFYLNGEGTAFEKFQQVPTVGAHGVATHSTPCGRFFVFFSNDKDERTTLQESELFEWVGLFPDGKLESREKVRTDGAHAAEFFSDVDKRRHFLAVANLGDRQTNKYRRDSTIYSLDLNNSAAQGEPLLRLVQKVPTLGATDFRAFSIGGQTYLAVSNEQDDVRGGDIQSTIWRLRDGEEGKAAAVDGGGGAGGGEL